jgi:hypothetical protein
MNKKLFISLLSFACYLSLGAKTSLSKQNTKLVEVQEKISTIALPMLDKVMEFMDETEAKVTSVKEDYLDPNQKKINVAFKASEIFLPFERTAISKTLAGVRSGYWHGMKMYSEIMPLVPPTKQETEELRYQLDEISKPGGLIDQVVAANNESARIIKKYQDFVSGRTIFRRP